MKEINSFSDKQKLGKSSQTFQVQEKWQQVDALIKFMFHGTEIYEKLSLQQTFNEHLHHCFSRFL